MPCTGVNEIDVILGPDGSPGEAVTHSLQLIRLKTLPVSTLPIVKVERRFNIMQTHNTVEERKRELRMEGEEGTGGRGTYGPSVHAYNTRRMNTNDPLHPEWNLLGPVNELQQWFKSDDILMYPIKVSAWVVLDGLPWTTVDHSPNCSFFFL